MESKCFLNDLLDSLNLNPRFKHITGNPVFPKVTRIHSPTLKNGSISKVSKTKLSNNKIIINIPEKEDTAKHHDTIKLMKNSSELSWAARLTIHEIRDSKYKLEKVPSMPKFLLKSDSNSYIKYENNEFYTDDEDLYLLLSYMNEEVKSWEHMVKNKNINCYRRPVPGSAAFLIKAVATVEGFLAEDVFRAIYDVNQRMSWDKVFKDFKVVIPESEKRSEVIYMVFESPSFLIDNRDFVQQRKVWKDHIVKESRIIHFKSVDIPECPIRKKHVRAHTTISGYYIETISVNPPKSKLIIVSQNDIKGYIPTYLVNKFAAKAPKNWVENLENGIKEIKKNKK